MSESVDSLSAILEAHAPWVALTGAGISSASGIPTYRDHKGTWLGSQPVQHDEFISQPFEKAALLEPVRAGLASRRRSPA